MSDAAAPQPQGAGRGCSAPTGTLTQPARAARAAPDFVVPDLRTAHFKRNAIARLGAIYFFLSAGRANNACKGPRVASCLQAASLQHPEVKPDRLLFGGLCAGSLVCA